LNDTAVFEREDKVVVMVDITVRTKEREREIIGEYISIFVSPLSIWTVLILQVKQDEGLFDG